MSVNAASPFVAGGMEGLAPRVAQPEVLAEVTAPPVAEVWKARTERVAAAVMSFVSYPFRWELRREFAPSRRSSPFREREFVARTVLRRKPAQDPWDAKWDASREREW